jgi:hypothetical protein
VDVSYWVIRALAVFRLAWDVKLPTAQAQAARWALPDRRSMPGA